MPRNKSVTCRLKQYLIPVTLLADHGCPEGRLGRGILFALSSWWSVVPVLHGSGIADDKTTGRVDSASNIYMHAGTEFRNLTGWQSCKADVLFGSLTWNRLSCLFSSVTPDKCQDCISIRPRLLSKDRLCGLVVRVSGYRGPGFDSRLFQIFWEAVGLERGPLSLVKTTEELYLDEKVEAPV
jgi:hypothetical protein